MLACKEAGTVSADESIRRISNLKIPEYITYIMACLGLGQLTPVGEVFV